MRVISINNCGQKSNQIFKGLWGAEDKKIAGAYYNTPSGMIFVGDSINIIKKDFHPFLDDTSDVISKAQQELTSKNCHDRKVGNEFTHHIYYEFIQKEKLPFTARNYEDYISGKLLPRAHKFVEENLKKAGLFMHIK